MDIFTHLSERDHGQSALPSGRYYFPRQALFFPQCIVKFDFGKMKQDLGKRPSEGVLQGRFREIARGLRPILNLETRAAGLFAWGFLDAQLVDAVVGVLGEFRPGVDEPFARRDFGLPLRRSGCRLARNVVALRARLLLRNEYFAVGKVRKGHVKCRLLARHGLALLHGPRRVRAQHAARRRFHRQVAIRMQ